MDDPTINTPIFFITVALIITLFVLVMDNCGPKFCPECGERYNKNTVYCDQCGVELLERSHHGN